MKPFRQQFSDVILLIKFQISEVAKRLQEYKKKQRRRAFLIQATNTGDVFVSKHKGKAKRLAVIMFLYKCYLLLLISIYWQIDLYEQ